MSVMCLLMAPQQRGMKRDVDTSLVHDVLVVGIYFSGALAIHYYQMVTKLCGRQRRSMYHKEAY